jgi:hypothetical protein
MPPLSWTLRDSPGPVGTCDRSPAYSFGERGKSEPKSRPAAFQSALSPTVLLPESFRGGCSFGAALRAHTRARPLLRACIRHGPCSTGGASRPANPDGVSAGHLLILVGNPSKPPAGLHPFVQNSNDLDEAGLDLTVRDNVHRSAHRHSRIVDTNMAKVKAAQAGLRGCAIASDEALRFICHDARCRRKNRRVAALPRVPPSVKTGGKNATEIRLRRARQTKARHAGSARSFGYAG